MKITFDFEKIEAFAKDLKQADLAKQFGSQPTNSVAPAEEHRESTLTRFCRYL